MIFFGRTSLLGAWGEREGWEGARRQPITTGAAAPCGGVSVLLKMLLLLRGWTAGNHVNSWVGSMQAGNLHGPGSLWRNWLKEGGDKQFKNSDEWSWLLIFRKTKSPCTDQWRSPALKKKLCLKVLVPAALMFSPVTCLSQRSVDSGNS